jgi:hypothetical protein
VSDEAVGRAHACCEALDLDPAEFAETIARYIERAVAEEREACAKIAETEFPGNGTHLTWREIAAAIRARQP